MGRWAAVPDGTRAEQTCPRPRERGDVGHVGEPALITRDHLHFVLFANNERGPPGADGPCSPCSSRGGPAGAWLPGHGHPEEPDQTPCPGSPEAPEGTTDHALPHPALCRSLCCYLLRFGLNLRCAPPASAKAALTCTEQPSSRASVPPCGSTVTLSRGWWLSCCLRASVPRCVRGFAPVPPVPHATRSPDVGRQYSLGMACCVSLVSALAPLWGG